MIGFVSNDAPVFKGMKTKENQRLLFYCPDIWPAHRREEHVPDVPKTLMRPGQQVMRSGMDPAADVGADVGAGGGRV
jgi:hypothetical protein